MSKALKFNIKKMLHLRGHVTLMDKIKLFFQNAQLKKKNFTKVPFRRKVVNKNMAHKRISCIVISQIMNPFSQYCLFYIDCSFI